MRTQQTEFYLIRHAESQMNTQLHLVGGQSNETPLTIRGIEQARMLGIFLKENSLLPDAVYSSTAVRTQQTAHHSLNEVGISPNISLSPDLLELSQGFAEGKSRQEVYTPEVLEQIYILGKDFKLEGGESMNEVAKRMLNRLMTIHQAFSQSSTPNRVFIYTHGGSIKYVASHLEGWSHQRTYNQNIGNTAINLFLADNENLRVIYLDKNPSDA